MKRLILISTLFVTIISCKKDLRHKEIDNPYLQQLMKSLSGKISATDFQAIDISKSVLRQVQRDNLYIVRIPFKEKDIKQEFILVQTNIEGNVIAGRIVKLDGQVSTSTKERALVFNGSVVLNSLDRKNELKSEISNGYMSAFHKKQISYRVESLTPDGTVLPEVFVIAYINNSDGVSYSTWFSIMSFLNSYENGGLGSYSYYDNVDPDGSEYGGGYSGGSSGGGQPPEPFEVEAEYIFALPGVDVNKMFKCFDNVPSSGATYTIKLCADLPSNNNPGASVNYSGVSAGHTFLTISKTNGSNSVTQSFGFYPQQQPSVWDPFSNVASEIKDNGLQEINASIEMNVNESQFNTIKQNAIAWSSRDYNIGDYNCSDYAIDIFNSVRTNPISPGPFTVYLPGTPDNFGSVAYPITVSINKSPQRLFQKLKEMKDNNSTEAASIVIDQTHNSYAPLSKGECN